MAKKRQRRTRGAVKHVALRLKGGSASRAMYQAKSWTFSTPEATCTLILTLDASDGPKGLHTQYRQYVVSCDHCSRAFRICMPVRPHASEGVEIAGVYAPAHAWRQLFSKVLGKEPKK